MTLLELVQSQRNEILQLAARRGAHNVRLFGSVVRDQTTAENDVDFLVDLDAGRSLLDLGGLLMDLQTLLNRKVDVVTEKALHWYIRERVLQESKLL